MSEEGGAALANVAMEQVPGPAGPDDRRELLLRALASEVGSGRPVSFALFELDHLAAGRADDEQSLRALAALLRQGAGEDREEHLGLCAPGQLGQILPGLNRQLALAHIDRARIAFESLGLKASPGPGTLTVSAGLAEFPFEARSAEELLARAEQAVVRAQRLGRNRCVGPPPRLLVIGGLPLLRDATRTLLARGEFLVHSETDGSRLLEAYQRERPNLLVADLFAIKRSLAQLGALRGTPEHAGSKIILVTTEGPDPSLPELARRVPGAQLLMGEARLLPRVVEAVTASLGVKPRRTLRAAVQIPVTFLRQGIPAGTGILLDLSESGARLKVTHPLAPGEAVTLGFSWEQQPVQIEAVAVRQFIDEAGRVEIGVRFAGLEDAQRAVLRLIVGEGTGPEVSTVPAPAARAAPSSPYAFQLALASRKYGDFEALQPITFSVKAGERIALIGPSGAGKSTLLRLLNTSIHPTAGSLKILGEDPSGLSPRALRRLRSRIGTIYQQLLLIPQASVLQNVIAGRLGRSSLVSATLSLFSRREANQVALVLDQVGIASKIYERVDTLSGGEQQRVAIARTLYQEPEIIIADEPLASVDPTRSAEIIDLLLQIRNDRTLILSTHQLEPVLPYFSRVIGLRAGKIIFDKNKAALTLDDLARLYESQREARPAQPPRAFSSVAVPVAGATVAVGASNTPGEFMLPRLIGAFIRERPGLKLKLSVKPSQQVIDDLIGRRIDLGFVGFRLPHPELHFEEFAPDELIMVAAPELSGLPATAAVQPSLVAQLPRVERTAGTATRAVVEERFASIGAPLSPDAIVMEAGNFVALKAAVMSGMGIAFVSRLVVRAELIAGTLREVRIENVKLPRRIFVAWRHSEELGPAARCFLEVARREILPPTEDS